MSEAARHMTRIRRAAMIGAIGLALASAAALAQTAAQLMPAPGEIKLSIAMGQRTVAFPAKSEPLARETIPFEAGGHAVTEEGRTAMGRLQEALFRQPGGSLVVIVYGDDEKLAFQRARAVRGELAERHSMDAGRIIATGRKAEGHAGDLAVVDVYGADPTRCGGCNGSTFRTLALDSAAMQLVTVRPEMLPQAQVSAAPARPAPAPAPRPPQRQAAAETAAPAPRAAAPRQAEGCPRPRIIIDDYYPGGPMVPCRASR